MSEPREQQIALPFTPYPHQRAAHAMRLAIRFLVLVWHRRGGKTVFAILELLLAAAACIKEAGRFGYICPELKQAKIVAWDYLQKFARYIPGVVVNQSELSVELPNGARVRLFGADNPDSFRGMYFDGMVLDEVADMKPNVWGEILRPALSDRLGWAIFIGTPKGVNLFSELYYRAVKGEDDWGADMKRGEETGVLPPGELEKAKREMTPAQFAQEYDCDFAASVEDVLLKLEDVLVAQKRDLRTEEYDFAAKVLGVDVARYGGDKSVLTRRQGLVCFKQRWRQGLDTMEVAAAVAQEIDDWHPDATMVDVGGIGAGVVDRLVQLGHTPIPVDFGGKANDPRFENRRAEMWWDTADWVKAGGCLPTSTDLQRDLTAPRYTYKNHRGRLQLESKDDLRKRGLPSPDFGDSLACTFFCPVAPKPKWGERNEGRGGRTASEYDPYA